MRKFAAILSLFLAIFAFWQGSGGFTSGGNDEALARQEIQELTSVAVEESESGVPLAGKRVDQVDVGQWVLAENPIEEDDLRFGSEVIPSEWRLLELRAPKKDGSFADVRMLRPRKWLQQQWEQKFTPQVASLVSFEDETGEHQQAVVLSDDLTDPLTGSRLHGPSVYVPRLDERQLIGQTIYISVPECGIDGDAHVLSIGTCPNISPRPGPEFQVVTATFHHHAATVLDLYIDDLKNPIGTTANHPFWSEDQQDFVRADELEPGETLRNANGSLTHVKHVSKRPGTHNVFNLEVQTKHTYHVAGNGVLVHNAKKCFEVFERFGSLAEADEAHILQKLSLRTGHTGPKRITLPDTQNINDLGKAKQYSHRITIRAKAGAREWLKKNNLPDDILGHPLDSTFAIPGNLLEEFNRDFLIDIVIQQIRKPK